MKNYMKLSLMTAAMICSLSVSTMQDSKPLISKEERNNFGIIGETKILKGHSGDIKSFAISHYSKYLATLSTRDDCMKLWDLKTGKYLNEVIIAFGVFVCFSADDKYLVEGSLGISIKIWPIENLLIQELNKNTEKKLRLEGCPLSTALSHNGKYIATSYLDPAKIYNIETGNCLTSLVGHRSKVIGVAFSKDDYYVVTRDIDCIVNVWEVETGKHLYTLPGNHRDVAMSSHNLVTKTNGTIKIWDIPEGKHLCDLDTSVQEMAFSHDGNYLVTESEGTVKIWCLKRCKLLLHIKDVNEYITCRLAFSHDNKYLIMNLIMKLTSKTAKIFNPRTGRCLLTLNDVKDCAFSPDGNYLVTTKSEVAMILQLKNQDDFINKEKELNRFDLNISYLPERFQKN